MRIIAAAILAGLTFVAAAGAEVPAAQVQMAEESTSKSREVVPVPAVPDSMAVPAPTVGDEVQKPPPEVPPDAAKAQPKEPPTIPDSERHDTANPSMK